MGQPRQQTRPHRPDVLALGDDGVLLVADGAFTYTLAPGGTLALAGMWFTPGFPGYARGVVAAGPGEYLITSANGHVARWWPERMDSEVLAEGFEQLYGIARTPAGAVFEQEKIHRTRWEKEKWDSDPGDQLRVRIDGDAATHQCYLQAQHVRHAADPSPNYIVGGRYEDDLVRTAAGWRIAHRRLVIQWNDGNPAVIRPEGAR